MFGGSGTVDTSPGKSGLFGGSGTADESPSKAGVFGWSSTAERSSGNSKVLGTSMVTDSPAGCAALAPRAPPVTRFWSVFLVTLKAMHISVRESLLADCCGNEGCAHSFHQKIRAHVHCSVALQWLIPSV